MSSKMPADDLRRRYERVLLSKPRDAKHPSATMIDRVRTLLGRL